MEIQIRSATHDDAVEACSVIRRSILECCYDDHRGDAAVIEQWLRNKKPQWVSQLMLAPGTYAFVATDDEGIVGFGSASRFGEITLCYAAPAVRFMGVGKSLLAAIEHHAMRAAMDSLHLNSTRTAEAFYLRNGFVRDGSAVAVLGIMVQPMRKTLVSRAVMGEKPGHIDRATSRPEQNPALLSSHGGASRSEREKAFDAEFGDWSASENGRAETHGIPGVGLRPW